MDNYIINELNKINAIIVYTDLYKSENFTLKIKSDK